MGIGFAGLQAISKGKKRCSIIVLREVALKLGYHGFHEAFINNPREEVRSLGPSLLQYKVISVLQDFKGGRSWYLTWDSLIGFSYLVLWAEDY